MELELLAEQRFSSLCDPNGPLFVLLGLLWILISLPLLFDKIAPNQFYGFRTRKMLSNKEIWYKANKYMAKDFIALGIIEIIYNVFLVVFNPAILKYEPTGNMLILMVGVAVIVIRGLLYLKKL